jgi:hypothetical protein
MSVRFNDVAFGNCDNYQQNLPETVQEHFIAYCSCKKAVKLFRFLLSPYSLAETCKCSELHFSLADRNEKWLESVCWCGRNGVGDSEALGATLGDVNEAPDPLNNSVRLVGHDLADRNI